VHSIGCTPLFCLDCSGLKLKDLKNPEFWRDMTKPLRSSYPFARTDKQVLAIPRHVVWHQQEVVSGDSRQAHALSGGNYR
jgi:hypothetical protein